MAYTITTQSDFSPSRPERRGASGVLKAIAQVFSVNRSMNSRMTQIARLQAMSDEDLSALGMKRDEIVHHVFRDIFYI